MNLTLSRRADYAVRAALELARRWPDGWIKIAEVAEAMALPRSYTPQILGLLARAGIAEARAGRDGGYRLAKPPVQVSLLQVVEAAEGPLAPERCTLRGGPCRWHDAFCAVHPAWEAGAEALRRSLERTSLTDMVRADRRLERAARGSD